MDSVSLFCQLHLVLIVYKLFVYKVSVTTVLSFPASGESGTAAGISAGQCQQCPHPVPLSWPGHARHSGHQVGTTAIGRSSCVWTGQCQGRTTALDTGGREHWGDGREEWQGGGGARVSEDRRDCPVHWAVAGLGCAL